MNSTLGSNTSKKATIAISGLDINYDLDVHHSLTFRDAFVNFFSGLLCKKTNTKTRLQVLSNLNLSIYEGDRVGVLGVNGAGKSSLCRAIAGGYKPKVGKIETSGKILAIFDTSMGIIPELTGRENATLLYEFLFPELSADNKMKLLKDALEFSELGDFVDVPFYKYSKGMQARLCLSVISSCGSDILILDEVFDGADEFFSKKISERVLDMINASGSVVFVSHSVEQVARVCNRVVVLRGGNVVFDGRVEDGITEYHRLYKGEL